MSQSFTTWARYGFSLFAALFLLLMHAEISNAQDDDAPHAVFVVGTNHYRPGSTLPRIAEQLETLGFRTTVILPEGNPEGNPEGIAGLEQLADADVAIFFMRYLTLPDDQLEHVLSYIQDGGAVVGLRTTSHAFKYPRGHKFECWNSGFGQLVFGSRCYIHLNGTTQVEMIDAAQDHPILTGFPQEEVTAAGTLYRSVLAEGAVPILMGTGHSERIGTVTNGHGTHEMQEIESCPVAWTWTNSWGGRVYASSIGHANSFENPAFVRLLINGIHWAADKEIPAADVEISPISR